MNDNAAEIDHGRLIHSGDDITGLITAADYPEGGEGRTTRLN